MPASTIDHGPHRHTVIPLDRCLGLARELQQAGKTWHFHGLSPVCVHNPYAGRYAIVIENDSDGVSYIASSASFPKVGKDLVKLLHGTDIVDPAKTEVARGEAAVSSAFIRRLLDLDAQGIAWHHHMHFPGCMLSPHPRRWTIVIESAESEFSETFDGEPVDVLREVEVLYFRRMEKNATA